MNEREKANTTGFSNPYNSQHYDSRSNALSDKPELNPGDQNDYVYDLQKYLIELDFLRGEPNGIFGFNTERAVRLFQQTYGLPITGAVDTYMWIDLENALNNPFPSTRPTLQLGDQGVIVKQLEQRLIMLGFLDVAGDGTFNENTEQAVINLQLARNLPADGIVDPRTWREIDQMFAAVDVDIPTLKPTIQEGDQNDYVKLLQEKLQAFGYFTGTVDGNFGRNTTLPVIKFQQTYGLTPNGIVDYFTWEVLDSLIGPNFVNLAILREGSTAPQVFILQEKLKIADFFPGTITGSFGPETTTAVKNFQESYHLPVTGVVDDETWRVLFRITAIVPEEIMPTNIYSTTTPVGQRPSLKYGDEGPYVTELQRDLKQLMFYDGDINGKFDTKTLDSVKAFQVNNKLTADGVVGRYTWSALIYLYSPLAICGGTGGENMFKGVVIDPGHGGYSYTQTKEKVSWSLIIHRKTLLI